MVPQGRRLLLESDTAIEHRWCAASADGTSLGGGGGWGQEGGWGKSTRGGLTPLS